MTKFLTRLHEARLVISALILAPLIACTSSTEQLGFKQITDIADAMTQAKPARLSQINKVVGFDVRSVSSTDFPGRQDYYSDNPDKHGVIKYVDLRGVTNSKNPSWPYASFAVFPINTDALCLRLQDVPEKFGKPVESGPDMYDGPITGTMWEYKVNDVVMNYDFSIKDGCALAVNFDKLKIVDDTAK